MLDGAEGITWSDANLTELGQDQAKAVHGLWKNLLPKGLPPPDTFYVSPLTRTIETADLSFKGLELPEDKSYKPLIKEVPYLTLHMSTSLTIHSSAEKRSGYTPVIAALPPRTSSPPFHT